MSLNPQIHQDTHHVESSRNKHSIDRSHFLCSGCFIAFRTQYIGRSSPTPLHTGPSPEMSSPRRGLSLDTGPRGVRSRCGRTKRHHNIGLCFCVRTPERRQQAIEERRHGRRVKCLWMQLLCWNRLGYGICIEGPDAYHREVQR